MSTNSKRCDQFSEYPPKRLDITISKGAVKTMRTAKGSKLQKDNLFNINHA